MHWREYDGPESANSWHRTRHVATSRQWRHPRQSAAHPPPPPPPKRLYHTAINKRLHERQETVGYPWRHGRQNKTNQGLHSTSHGWVDWRGLLTPPTKHQGGGVWWWPTRLGGTCPLRRGGGTGQRGHKERQKCWGGNEARPRLGENVPERSWKGQNNEGPWEGLMCKSGARMRGSLGNIKRKSARSTHSGTRSGLESGETKWRNMDAYENRIRKYSTEPKSLHTLSPTWGLQYPALT